MSHSRLNRTPVTVEEERMAERCAQGRVIVIDDDADWRDAIASALELEGYAWESHASALSFLSSRQPAQPAFPGPCCFLCDVRMPGMDGLELQTRLLAETTTPFLLISGESGAREAATAFRAGALDFLTKPVALDKLLEAIDRALAVSRERRSRAEMLAEMASRVSQLTPRELRVVRLVVEGLTNPEIAATMNVALRTAKLYRQRAIEKLGVSRLADLVRMADALGI